MACVLKGHIHAVVLTGGLASSALLTGWIAERAGFLARVLIYPGEDEMRTLAAETRAVLHGMITPLEY